MESKEEIGHERPYDVGGEDAAEGEPLGVLAPGAGRCCRCLEADAADGGLSGAGVSPSLTCGGYSSGFKPQVRRAIVVFFGEERIAPGGGAAPNPCPNLSSEFEASVSLIKA